VNYKAHANEAYFPIATEAFASANATHRNKVLAAKSKVLYCTTISQNTEGVSSNGYY
jgi:hypothetical protein